MSVKWDVKRGELDPEFNADVNQLLADSPDSWCVTWGRRDPAQQLALWQKGRDAQGNVVNPKAVVTNAKPGRSAHEHGLAVDVARVDEHGKLCWDVTNPAWPRLWAAIKAHPRLHSGHDFPPVAPADDDHIQAVKWYKLRSELQARGEW